MKIQNVMKKPKPLKTPTTPAGGVGYGFYFPVHHHDEDHNPEDNTVESGADGGGE